MLSLNSFFIFLKDLFQQVFLLLDTAIFSLTFNGMVLSITYFEVVISFLVIFLFFKYLSFRH